MHCGAVRQQQQQQQQQQQGGPVPREKPLTAILSVSEVSHWAHATQLTLRKHRKDVCGATTYAIYITLDAGERII
jgi:hypothetical protein